MATDFDPYRILQITPDASDDDVRSAYERERVILGDGAAGEEALREVETAYRILGDPDQRRAYDERRAEAVARGYAPPANLREAPSAKILACPRCGAPAHSGAKFCGSCGRALPAPAPEGRAPWGYGDILKAIGVMIGGILLTGIPIYILAEAMAGDSAIEDDPNAWTLVLVSNFAVQFLMIGSAYWFGVRKYGLGLSALGLRPPERGRVLLTIGLLGGAYAILITWGILLQALGIEPDTDLPEQTYEDIRPIIALVILSVILAPISEETFFRGFVFGSLRWRWGFLLAALASGALFSLAHIGNPGYIVVLPSIVGIGALFAWGYYFSGSLYPPIIAHLLFNLSSVTYSIATA
jgi:membrane protease YdiL (CAAX protease family)